MQEQNEPGAVITPGATVGGASQPPVSAPVSLPIMPLPEPTETSVSPINPPLDPTTYPLPTEVAHQEDGLFMTWQTQESDDQAKQGAWYMAVVLVAIVLTGVVFFLTGKDVFASVAVFLAVICFAYLGSHKPKDQQYALAQEGIYVGEKLRSYEEFKNFSEIDEASGPAIILIPHKRFASPLVLKLTHDTIDEAVDTLTNFLPVENRKPDAIDQLVRRMRL